MEKLVIIDGNSLVNRAFYAMPPLYNSDGINCNAVYGVANILARLMMNNLPEYICVAFDAGRHTFRNDMYAEYKATRKGMPDDLARQMPILKEMLQTMGIAMIERKGVEADDLIGSLSRKFPSVQNIIVTGDRDALQLINKNTEVWLTKKGISEISVMNRQTFTEEWGLAPCQIIDLKALMGDASDNIPGVPGVGEKTALNLLKNYHFVTRIYENLDKITGRLREKLEQNKDICLLSYRLATIKCDVPIEFELQDLRTQFPWGDSVYDFCNRYEFRSITRREELFGQPEEPAEEIVCEANVVNLTQIREIVEQNRSSQMLSLFSNDNVFEFAFSRDKNYSIDLIGVNKAMILSELREFLTRDDVTIFAYSLKDLYRECEALGIKLRGQAFDVPLAAYLINSNIKVDDPTHMLDFFGLSHENYAAMGIRAWDKSESELGQKGLEKLYFDLELPLVRILYEMETNGITIDTRIMADLEPKYRSEIEDLRRKICDLAGCEFNVNSPKQLGHVLFDILHLNSARNKKKSTSVEILEALRGTHPIIDVVLRYRTTSKLYSTYIESMHNYIRADGKIHTQFNQTVTVTGRLSSNEPNLQNIPVRTEEGRELRKMFVASKGCRLVSADYSQIELRLLAHYSQDEVLIQAYRDGRDIHAITASQIFGVPLEMVTDQMRRRAKAVNFGIIYGISSYGLASNIGISPYEAKQYIDRYFETYPTIKNFMDSSIEQYRRTGKVTTLLGRIRNFDSGASGKVARFIERAAMNMPLQGSVSDIIKLAMLGVDREIKKRGLKAKMVLQIHDELIIDTPENEVATVRTILKDVMENVIELRVPLVVDVEDGYSWFEV